MQMNVLLSSPILLEGLQSPTWCKSSESVFHVEPYESTGPQLCDFWHSKRSLHNLFDRTAAASRSVVVIFSDRNRFKKNEFWWSPLLSRGDVWENQGLQSTPPPPTAPRLKMSPTFGPRFQVTKMYFYTLIKKKKASSNKGLVVLIYASTCPQETGVSGEG